MNKNHRNATAIRLSARLDRNTKQITSLLSPTHGDKLLTTEERAHMDRLTEESTLLNIEVETFLADFHASRHPLKFLKRHIFNNR